MYIIYDQLFLKHDTGMMHPENSGRLPPIVGALKDWQKSTSLCFTGPGQANPGLPGLVHSQAYVKKIKAYSEKGGQTYLDGDTVVSKYTYPSAVLAVSGAAKGIDLIFAEQGPSSFFALVRPPGHHAFRETGSGFCIFNNVAVAAAYAFQAHGLDRIAVIDFDAHHGNGTQDLFYGSDRLFYISFHQYPHYPGTGSYDQRGQGKGKGYTLNIPLAAGTGEESYFAAFAQLVLPLMEGFGPQLILVSAGYDSHHLDPLSSLGLCAQSYKKIMYLISHLSHRFCRGRMGIVLEGGYQIEVLGECARNTVLGGPDYAQKHKQDIENILETGSIDRKESQIAHIKGVWGL